MHLKILKLISNQFIDWPTRSVNAPVLNIHYTWSRDISIQYNLCKQEVDTRTWLAWFYQADAFVDNRKKNRDTDVLSRGTPKVLILTFCFIFSLIRNELNWRSVGLLMKVILSYQIFWRIFFSTSKTYS